MLHRIICTIVMLIALSIVTNAQVIKGKIVDATTGNPIPNASVYLNRSSKGTISNTQGEFVLYTDETKKSLIVSYVGYQSDTILNYNNKLLNIKLKPRTNELKEVVIGVSNMTREKQMKIFLTQFIGSSSKDCIISNPDDINFTYHKKTRTLEADVNQPLIIHNKKLGYKITYFLSAFSYAPVQTSYPTESSYYMETSYKGNYVFEEDTLGLTPTEIKKIRKARDRAYYGSRMRFIRLVLAGVNWRENLANDREKTKFYYWYNNHNFYHDEINFIFNNIRANKEQLLNNTVINDDGGRYFLARPTGYITYNGFDHSEVTFQSGELTVKKRFDEVPLTANSYNESNLIWSGKMGEQRVGDLLPIDFEPSEALSKPQQQQSDISK